MTSATDFKATLRLGTDDEYVWSTVYVQNEYRLPDTMDGWRVLDIGGNIGAFARLCCDRGAAFVLSYEPCPDNRGTYIANLDNVAASVILRPEAVWSAHGYVMLRQHHTGLRAHACKSIVMNLSQPGIMVPVVTFGEALMNAEEWEFVKIDCEGSEYALFDCEDEVIRRAARYAIEFHLPHRHNEVQMHMEGRGYRLAWRKDEGQTAIMGFARA